jgi:hypothetical protein
MSTSKNAMSIIGYVFNKIGEKGRKGSAWKPRRVGGEGWGGWGGEMAQTMYVHMIK